MKKHLWKNITSLTEVIKYFILKVHWFKKKLFPQILYVLFDVIKL